MFHCYAGTTKGHVDWCCDIHKPWQLPIANYHLQMKMGAIPMYLIVSDLVPAKKGIVKGRHPLPKLPSLYTGQITINSWILPGFPFQTTLWGDLGWSRYNLPWSLGPTCWFQKAWRFIMFHLPFLHAGKSHHQLEDLVLIPPLARSSRVLFSRRP